MHLGLLLLPLAVLAQSDDMEQASKLIACMQVTRNQLIVKREALSQLAEKSPFPKKDVLTKAMAQMIIECVDRIPLEECQEAIMTKEELPARLLEYAPVPTEPFLTPESVALTESEDILIKDIIEKSEQAKREKSSDAEPRTSPEYEEKVSKPEPALGTSLGIVYILTVFLVFAGLVLYGIKRIQDRDEKQSKKRKKT